MNDEQLCFEHSLRAYTNAALERIEAFDNEMGEYHATWDISYDTADGGSWRVTPPYRYRVSGSFRTASLHDALDIAFNACRDAMNKRTLPSLLTSDSNA